MPIKGVTFDLWQTLLMDNQELGRARMRVRLEGALEALREAGEEFSEDQVLEAYRRCYRTCHDIRAQRRDVTFMEQIEIFVRHIDCGLMDRLQDGAVERIATTYADSLFSYPPPPHPDAVSVLSGVKAKGYLVALISNTGMTPGVTFRAYMKQIGILRYFDALTFSDEVRLAKPSREIFLQTIQSLGIPPEQTVHVGDHMLNDVVGARQAGLRTIWIDWEEEARQEVDVQPDATVTSLGQVSAAIEGVALANP